MQVLSRPAQLIVSTSSEPAAAPVASDGVSIPPAPPARRNSAVSSGFSARIAAADDNVMPLARLTVRMLRPLPGNSGHQCEQMPITSPAPASAGTSTQDRIRRAGRAAAMSRLNASPTSERHRRQHQPARGQQKRRIRDWASPGSGGRG